MNDETRARLDRALDAYVMAVQADPEAVGDGRLDAEEAYSAALTAHEQAARAEAVLAFARKYDYFRGGVGETACTEAAHDHIAAQGWLPQGPKEGQ